MPLQVPPRLLWGNKSNGMPAVPTPCHAGRDEPTNISWQQCREELGLQHNEHQDKPEGELSPRRNKEHQKEGSQEECDQGLRAQGREATSHSVLCGKKGRKGIQS